MSTWASKDSGSPDLGGDIWRSIDQPHACLPRGDRWAVVLAGGDGQRLLPLTRFISGDDRPKQFCPVLGPRSLLKETRLRAERLVAPNRVLYSLTRHHQRFYNHDLANLPFQTVVQPSNRGTAPAILQSLLRVFHCDREATVAILPSDHHFSNDGGFLRALKFAFGAAELRTDKVVVMGAKARCVEVGFGWIEKAQGGAPGESLFEVRAFYEKPSLSLADKLFDAGCLWNTFVMVGTAKAFLCLARKTLGPLYKAMSVASTSLGYPEASDSLNELYDAMEPVDFSRQVLAPCAPDLLTFELQGAEWNDLGDPGRVITTIEQCAISPPAWIEKWLRRGSAPDFSPLTLPQTQ